MDPTFEQNDSQLIVFARSQGITIEPLSDSVTALTWEGLHDRRSLYRRAARAIQKEMRDGISADELKKLETLHTHTMDAIDCIADEFGKRDRNGTRDSRRPAPMDAEVMGDGSTTYRAAADWSDSKGAEVRTVKRGESFSTERYQGPSLGAQIRAMVMGARNEDERRALSEGTDSAGGYTVSTPLAAGFIDRLRANAVVVRAGAVTVPMTSETLAIARLETDPTAAWRAENAEIVASDPTFGRVLFTAKSLTARVKVSRELLEDSVNVTGMLENAFAKSLGLEFDRACLFGTGADSQPTGLFTTSGINSVSMGTNGAAPTNYDPFLDALYELQLDNAAAPTAAIFHPRTGRTLNKLKDGQNNTLAIPTAIANLPMLTTTAVPIDQTQGSSSVASTILTGDFTQMLLGIRSTLRIEVLKERSADYHQYEFIAHMRADMQIAQPKAFCKVIGVIA